METDYIIISKPVKIQFMCPHCEKDIEMPFDEVDFNTEYWGDGAWVTCPECEKDVELGRYDYN